MDNQLDQLTAGLDRLDRLLRGNGTPGLVARHAEVQTLLAAHAAQLAVLNSLPRDLADLKAQIEAASKASAELAARVEDVIKEAREEALLQKGERRAVDKAQKWLRFTAVLVGAVGIGGLAGVAALVDRLAEIAAALP